MLKPLLSLLSRSGRATASSAPSRADDGFVFEDLEPRQLMTIVVNTPIANVSTTRAATPTFINLNNRYTDNWVTSVVRFATNSGNLDIALFGGAAPNTVANFLNYVNTGAYNNTIFHREVELGNGNTIGVLQGGGFRVPQATYTAPFPAEANQSPQPIATNPDIDLEHPTGNVRGTIAMARTNNINSATSQFFFNTANNSAVLDDPTPEVPNSGYAVFGQLTAASLAVLDALSAFRNSDMSPDYNAGSGGNGGSFENLPLRKDPVQHVDGVYVDPPIAPSDFLQITSATVLPDSNIDAVANNIYRSIEVTSSNSNIATASIIGGSLVVTPSATNLGSVTISVRITGLDGTVVTDDFTFAVENAVPTVGGVQGQSNVPQGRSMLVSAFGVRDTDVAGGAISSVAFYYDADGDGELGEGDQLLATDNAAGGGWNARIATSGMETGANRIFARVTDNDGATATTTLVVNLRAPVPTGAIDPEETTSAPGQNVDIEVGDLPDGSSIRRVSIFMDTDGDGLLNPRADRLIGHASYDTGSSTWRFTVDGGDLEAGLNRIFARTTDNYGNLGGLTSSTITVTIP